MSDSDDYDGDDFGGHGDYYFLEDEYGPADDLAEHACPSPIQYNGDDEWDEHTRFTNYWADLAYNSDSYFSDREADTNSKLTKKRGAYDAIAQSPTKKRKLHVRSQPGSPILPGHVPPPILWVSQVQRPLKEKGRIVEQLPAPAVVVPNSKRLHIMTTSFGKTQSNTKLTEVADAPEEELAMLDTPSDEEEAQDGDDDRWEDGSFSGEEDGRIDAKGKEKASDVQVMPEMMQRALQEHFSKMGIQPNLSDMAAVMEFASKMVSGEGDSDAIADDMMKSIFGGMLEEDEDDGEEEGGDEEEDGNQGSDMAPDTSKGVQALPHNSEFKRWLSKEADISLKENTRKQKDVVTEAAAEPWPPPVSSKDISGSVEERRLKRKADHGFHDIEHDVRSAPERLAKKKRPL